MRGLVIALLLSACSSSEAGSSPASDTAAPTCATTSCVPGASCRIPGGGTCQCFDAGEWSCGATPAPFDTGPVFDSARPDSFFTAPPADSEPPPPAGWITFSFGEGACDGGFLACTDSTTIETARTRLRDAMVKCGLTCTSMILELTDAGCPYRMSINFEPLAGALACAAKSIGGDRYPCASKITVDVTAGCLD